MLLNLQICTTACTSHKRAKQNRRRRRKKCSHKSELAQFTAADRCPGCDKRNLSMFTALSIRMTYHADPYNDFNSVFTLAIETYHFFYEFFSLTHSLPFCRPTDKRKKVNKRKWENFLTRFIFDSSAAVLFENTCSSNVTDLMVSFCFDVFVLHKQEMYR